MIDTNQIREIIEQMGLGEKQKALLDMLKEVEDIEADGSSGGDMVVVTATGARRVRRIRISDEAAADREMLEDLIVSATNDALDKAGKAAQEKLMSSFPAALMSGGVPPFPSSS